MKVCIIGYSLTSLALAKALVNKDIFVDVICSKKFKRNNQTRTLGISRSNIEFFNKYISNINKFLWDIKNIEIYTENLKKDKIIKFAEKKHKLFSILENQKLFDQLKSELEKNKFFNYKFKYKYNDIINYKYNLIINCDFNHEITKKFFFKKFEKDYDSIAITTILEHKKVSLNNTATQIFTNTGPLAFLPISNVKTSIVYSFRNEKCFKETNIISLIKKFNPKYKIKKINNLSKFSLKSFNLRKYYKNNILAFGDLLHKIHPHAGQGFNMTIRDIKDLMKIIDNKIELGLPIDSNVCTIFQNKTKSRNYIFSYGIDLIYEFFNFESKVQSGLLSSTVKFFAKSKTITKYFQKFADIGLRA